MIVCEANGEIRVSFNFYQHQSRSEFANNKMRIRKIDQNAFWLKKAPYVNFILFICSFSGGRGWRKKVRKLFSSNQMKSESRKIESH